MAIPCPSGMLVLTRISGKWPMRNGTLSSTNQHWCLVQLSSTGALAPTKQHWYLVQLSSTGTLAPTKQHPHRVLNVLVKPSSVEAIGVVNGTAGSYNKYIMELG